MKRLEEIKNMTEEEINNYNKSIKEKTKSLPNDYILLPVSKEIVSMVSGGGVKGINLKQILHKIQKDSPFTLTSRSRTTINVHVNRLVKVGILVRSMNGFYSVNQEIKHDTFTKITR